MEKHRCVCPDGFGGLFCEADFCKGFCKNNGKCAFHPVMGPRCTCLNNFSGDNCEIDDLCPHCDDANVPNCNVKCQNNGYCRKDGDGKEACVCVGEWVGTLCETPPRCIDDTCGKCSESSSINECTCEIGLVQSCTIGDGYPNVVVTGMQNGDHDTLSAIIILMFTLVLMSTLAFIAVFYVRRWQRRTRFFVHARLNENVEEITNPIFDFAATERDDISMPVTNISSNDDKVSGRS